MNNRSNKLLYRFKNFEEDINQSNTYLAVQMSALLQFNAKYIFIWD